MQGAVKHSTKEILQSSGICNENINYQVLGAERQRGEHLGVSKYYPGYTGISLFLSFSFYFFFLFQARGKVLAK